MKRMIVLILGLLGLLMGSFVNALVWRLHEQETLKTKKKKTKQGLSAQDLSITRGRSMCPSCHHTLAAKDLIPVLSWVELRGKCRYCKAKIEDTPLTELGTAWLFMASYIWWPLQFNLAGKVNFAFWLIMLVGFVALFLYDVRWMLLPNKIIFPLAGLAAVLAILNITVFHSGLDGLKNTVISLAIAAGLFFTLYQLSKGKWIGGGDVKLGLLIGLLITSPIQAFLVLFLSSILGTVTIVPGLATKRLNAKSHIPYGPFLIAATIIIRLFGASFVSWYKHKFLLY